MENTTVEDLELAKKALVAKLTKICKDFEFDGMEARQALLESLRFIINIFPKLSVEAKVDTTGLAFMNGVIHVVKEEDWENVYLTFIKEINKYKVKRLD